MRTASLRSLTALAVAALVLTALPLAAQDQAGAAALRATPERLALEVGGEARVTVVVVDARGAPLDGAGPVTLIAPRGPLSVEDGIVTAHLPGEHELIATLAREGAEPLQLRIPVTVSWPPIAELRIELDDPRLTTWVGTTRFLTATALHADGSARPEAEIGWEVASGSGVLSVDRLGVVRALAPGSGVVRATADGVSGTVELTVRPLPEGELTLTVETGVRDDLEAVRTGDVLTFRGPGRAG